MAVIETLYRCRIDYMWSHDCEDAEGACERVNRKAMKFARVEGPHMVDLESFDGCPACHPYIQIESSSKVAAERVAGKTERWIKRLKDVELCPTG